MDKRQRVRAGSVAMLLAAAIMCAATTGCFSIKSQHEVKPIHITLDVNLKVEKELQNFFADIDSHTPAPKSAPAGSEPAAGVKPAEMGETK